LISIRFPLKKEGRDTPKDTPAHSRRLDRSLVLDAIAVGARPAEMVAVEVRQVVVVVFDALDQVAAAKPETTACTHAALSAGVGAHVLQSGVVRLYGVVVILGGWVRGSRCRLTLAAHGATPPE
jgi:hypothetical protein